MSHRANTPLQLPITFVNEWHREPSWLATIPQLVEACARKWNLELGAPIDTPHSLVLLAGDVVLKLNAPSHMEAEYEADALAAWAGEGAAQLVHRDRELRAFVIERCIPGVQLWHSDADDCNVVGGLLQRLLVPAPVGHSFRTLAGEAEQWRVELQHRWEQGGLQLERALVERALETFASANDTANWLVNQDLHGGNVLSAQRESWLVIDPKPLVGEPELDAVGLLRNAAWQEGATGVRRWLDALREIGLDRERMQSWGLAHALAWGWDEHSGWSSSSVDAARIIATA